MPTRRAEDGTPVVEFDPRLEVSPFTLFRRLRQDEALRLVDLRDVESRQARTLKASEPWPGEDWEPASPEEEVILLDDDGSRAVPLAARLQEAGFPRVRALFGGLDLYEFSLDPEVVGEETFLRRRG